MDPISRALPAQGLSVPHTLLDGDALWNYFPAGNYCSPNLLPLRQPLAANRLSTDSVPNLAMPMPSFRPEVLASFNETRSQGSFRSPDSGSLLHSHRTNLPNFDILALRGAGEHTHQQMPEVTQETSPVSSSQLPAPIESFDPFYISGDVVCMDPVHSDDPWTANGAREVGCADSPKDSEPGYANHSWTMNGAQEVGDEDDTSEPKPRCWEHGCNGRAFSTRSNLIRHQIEKSQARRTCKCPRCGAVFSRTSARNQHVAKRSCNRIRRYSNGRERRCPRVVD